MALGENNEDIKVVSDNTLSKTVIRHEADPDGRDPVVDVISLVKIFSVITFNEIPDDILFVVLSYCDVRTLGRLGSVCWRFNELARCNCVWIRHQHRLTVIQKRLQNKCKSNKNQTGVVKEQCRVATNWKNGLYRVKEVTTYHVKQMPCMQLYNDKLWISSNNKIKRYQQSPKKFPLPCPTPDMTLTSRRSYRTDVSRFVCRAGMIVNGAIDGSVTACNVDDGELIAHYSHAHNDDVLAIDCCNDVILSGSRDMSVKMWRTNQPASEALQLTIAVGDRVCSVAIDPNERTFTIGSAGIGFLPPLQVWDFERTERLGSLGSGYKLGAGVLDIQYETSNVLLTCGYDTFIRLWDLRASYTSCMLSWEEPFDSAFYCIQTDGNNAILAGTSHYGLVQLWDKRNTKKQVQLYYAGFRSSSPVYSLVFDSSYMFVALDKGIHILNFD